MVIRQQHYAAIHGNTTILTQLVEANANLSARNLIGHTALNYAAFNSAGEIPLLLATKSGQLEMALIIAKSLGIKTLDCYGYNAVHYAAIYGKTAILEGLIKEGADLKQCSRSENQTPLILVLKNDENKNPSNLWWRPMS